MGTRIEIVLDGEAVAVWENVPDEAELARLATEHGLDVHPLSTYAGCVEAVRAEIAKTHPTSPAKARHDQIDADLRAGKHTFKIDGVGVAVKTGAIARGK